MANITSFFWSYDGENGIPCVTVTMDLTEINNDTLSIMLFDQHIIGTNAKQIRINGVIRNHIKNEDGTETFCIACIGKEKAEIGSPVVTKSIVTIGDIIQFEIKSIKFMDFDGSLKNFDAENITLMNQYDSKFMEGFKNVHKRAQHTKQYFKDMMKLHTTYNVYRAQNDRYKFTVTDEYHISRNLLELEKKADERRSRIADLEQRLDNGGKSNLINGLVKANKWLDCYYYKMKKLYKEKLLKVPSAEDHEISKKDIAQLKEKFKTEQDKISQKYPELDTSETMMKALPVSNSWQTCRIDIYAEDKEISKRAREKVQKLGEETKLDHSIKIKDSQIFEETDGIRYVDL